MILYDVGKHIIEGLINGIKNGAESIGGVIKDVGGGILHSVTSFFGIGSPSRETIILGRALTEGLGVGIGDGGEVRTVLQKLSDIGRRMLDYLHTLVPMFRDLGLALMQGLAAGIQAGAGAAVAAAVAVAQQVEAATRTQTQTHSPSRLYAEVGQDLMAGLAQGIAAGLASVRAAMVRATAPTPLIGGVGGLSAVGLGGGRTVTISAPVTVNAKSGANAQDIAREVQQAVARNNAELLRALRAS